MKHFSQTWRCTAVVAAFALATSGAFAQESLVDQQPVVELPAVEAAAIEAEPLSGEYLSEPAVVGAYGPELPHGAPPVRSSQPVNWISGPYLKAGVVLGFDGGILASQDVGYTISGGFRQPLSPALDERLFFDLGGSYLSAYGEKTNSTAGIETTRNALGTVVNTRTVADAFETTLKEVQRASAHLAVGWYWGEPLDYRSNDPQWRLATRLGGRLGHVRGHFDDVLNNVPVDPNFPIPPNTRTFATTYQKTDTAGGLFVGTELMILNRDYAGGSVQWTIDGEYANDWMEFGGWGSGSLGTATVMTGFMYSR